MQEKCRRYQNLVAPGQADLLADDSFITAALLVRAAGLWL